MKLQKKCTIAVSLVLGVQLALFGLVGYSFVKREQEAERAEYAQRLISKSSVLIEQLNEASFLLFSYYSQRREIFGKRFDSLYAQINQHVEELKNESFRSDEDKKDIDVIVKSAVYLLDGLHEIRERGHLADFDRLVKSVGDELSAYAGDSVAAAERLAARHRSDTSVADVSFRDGSKKFIITCIAINFLTVIILVVVFTKGVASRLLQIADNVHRMATRKTLHPVQGGNDEIALLDKQFHEMAETVERQTEKERSVFENVPIGLLTLNQFGVLESSNPCANKMFEMVDHSESTFNVLSFFSETDRASQILDAVGKNEGEQGPWRLSMKRTDGSVFPAEIALAPYKDKGQSKIVLSALDVTHREEIERMKQEFVSVVSHDIRTPLTSIQACLTMLSEGSLGGFEGRAIKYIDLARVESERLIRLTTDLLDIAKLESGNVTVERTSLPVEELMITAANAVDAAANKKGIALVIEPTELKAYADLDRTIQILVNFLSNAIKFTPEDRRVLMKASSHADFVEISVSDEGCGIAEEKLAEVFERFKQARPEDSKKGAGLGLAICKLLAQCQDGSVGVKSVVGQGSTFWLRLPGPFE